MRLNHLGPVAEVNFVAIVVRWIVTCCDHDAGICLEITNSKGKFWHGPRSLEHACVAAIFSRDFRCNFGELFREKARIMRDYELRLRRDRKSTRLNSSHITTSYAVFCLKKKKTLKQ